MQRGVVIYHLPLGITTRAESLEIHLLHECQGFGISLVQSKEQLQFLFFTVPHVVTYTFGDMQAASVRLLEQLYKAQAA